MDTSSTICSWLPGITDGRPFLLAVSHHDGFVKAVGRLPHVYVDVDLVSDCDRYRFESQVAELKDGFLVGDSDDITSVDIGNGTCICALNHYGDSDQRFLLHVTDCTVDCNSLFPLLRLSCFGGLRQNRTGGVECRSLLTALPSEADESIGESRKAAKMTAAFPFSLSVGMLEFWLVC